MMNIWSLAEIDLAFIAMSILRINSKQNNKWKSNVFTHSLPKTFTAQLGWPEICTKGILEPTNKVCQKHGRPWLFGPCHEKMWKMPSGQAGNTAEDSTPPPCRSSCCTPDPLGKGYQEVSITKSLTCAAGVSAEMRLFHYSSIMIFPLLVSSTDYCTNLGLPHPKQFPVLQ